MAPLGFNPRVPTNVHYLGDRCDHPEGPPEHSAGVGRLVVAGAQTDACIRSTIHGAFTRGYDVVLAGDAHTSDDFTEYGMPPPDKVIAHMNGYWKWQDAPGRKADVTETAKVDFSVA